MAKPITPQDAIAQSETNIPDFVFEGINHLIVKHIHGDDSVTLKQNDIIDELLRRSNYCRQDLFDNCWLNFESVYEKAGWEVLYDKPGYCESYEPTFTFIRKSLDKYNF